MIPKIPEPTAAQLDEALAIVDRAYSLAGERHPFTRKSVPIIDIAIIIAAARRKAPRKKKARKG